MNTPEIERLVRELITEMESIVTARWTEKIGPLDQGETLEIIVRKRTPLKKFHRLQVWYLQRNLYPEELHEIAELKWHGWRKAVAKFLIKKENREKPVGELIALARKHGYKHDEDFPSWLNRFNRDFSFYGSPYRLTHANEDPKVVKETLCRFYRLAN